MFTLTFIPHPQQAKKFVTLLTTSPHHTTTTPHSRTAARNICSISSVLPRAPVIANTRQLHSLTHTMVKKSSSSSSSRQSRVKSPRNSKTKQNSKVRNNLKEYRLQLPDANGTIIRGRGPRLCNSSGHRLFFGELSRRTIGVWVHHISCLPQNYKAHVTGWTKDSSECIVKFEEVRRHVHYMHAHPLHPTPPKPTKRKPIKKNPSTSENNNPTNNSSGRKKSSSSSRPQKKIKKTKTGTQTTSPSTSTSTSPSEPTSAPIDEQNHQSLDNEDDADDSDDLKLLPIEMLLFAPMVEESTTDEMDGMEQEKQQQPISSKCEADLNVFNDTNVGPSMVGDLSELPKEEWDFLLNEVLAVDMEIDQLEELVQLPPLESLLTQSMLDVQHNGRSRTLCQHSPHSVYKSSASISTAATAATTAPTNAKARTIFVPSRPTETNSVVVAPAEKTTNNCQPPQQPVHATGVHKTKQLTATMSPPATPIATSRHQPSALTIDNMVSIIDYMPSGTLQINAVAFGAMWLSRLVYFHGRHIGLPLFLSLCYERPYVMFSHVVFFTAEAGMIALLLLLWVLQSRLFEQRWCCAPCKTLGVNLNARIRPVGASYIRSFCCCFVIFHVLNTALRLNVFDCRPEVCVRVPCWVVSL